MPAAEMKYGPFVEHRLSNGLRVIIEPMPHAQSAAAGFLVRTGARDESPPQAGVSHFLEHMCFKGTPRRTWQQITLDFDDMGSTYNAFTSKERTFYFGWVRVADLEKQIELLADMMQSTLPPEEFVTEKKVILEEIAMSDDQIDRQVYELIHEKVYSNHSLSWPVLGTTQTITDLSREALQAYHQDRYNAANMILLVAGAVDSNEVLKIAERHCGEFTPGNTRPQRQQPRSNLQGMHVSVKDRFKQQAVLLAFPAPSARDKESETADVLAAILGGHNSRFYWNIIQVGIAPYVYAFRLDYCDTGLLIAYGFGEPAKAEMLCDAMRREIQAISKGGVTDAELQRVKNRTRTALATEAEAPYYRLMQLAGEIDVFDRPRTVAQRLAEIDAVTVERINEYLKKWPIDGNGCLLSLGPRRWPL